MDSSCLLYTSQAAHAHIGAAGQLAPHADDHRPEEGCPLAADVEKPEVLARLLRRDDLCKVGAAEGLQDVYKRQGYSRDIVSWSCSFAFSGFFSIVSSCPPKHNERFVNHNSRDAKRPPLEGEASLHVSGIIEGIFVAL